VENVLVDLLGVAVLPEHTAEDPLPPHPHDGEGETGVSGTGALTGSSVAALADGLLAGLHAAATVHDERLLDDVSVLDGLLDVGAAVGKANLVHLVGVNPDLSLSALEHGGGEALLKT